MSIYIVTHKKFNQPKEPGYKSLLVGAYKGHVFGDVFDDEGDNISQKNANYCELTGLYWMWKNCKDDDIVGLTHYRRYFSNSYSKTKILTYKDAEKYLKKNDIILPFIQHMPVSIKEHYCEESGLEKDLERIGKIIKDKYPEYYEDYNKFLDGQYTSFYNMFISKQEIFQDYCAWLFDILFELEKQVDYSDYNDYQKRIFGFLSERLLNVYVRHKKLKVAYVGVIHTEETQTLKKRVLTGLKRQLISGNNIR